MKTVLMCLVMVVTSASSIAQAYVVSRGDKVVIDRQLPLFSNDHSSASVITKMGPIAYGPYPTLARCQVSVAAQPGQNVQITMGNYTVTNIRGNQLIVTRDGGPGINLTISCEQTVGRGLDFFETAATSYLLKDSLGFSLIIKESNILKTNSVDQALPPDENLDI